MRRTGCLASALLALALAGCASSRECPSSSVYTEGPHKGQCASAAAVKRSEAQGHHADEVKKELTEAEAVLRQRRAEEAADAVEAVGR